MVINMYKKNLSFTWNKEWITKYESLYSFFQKIIYANNMSRNDIIESFSKTYSINTKNLDLNSLDNWNTNSVKNISKFNIIFNNQKIVHLISKSLRVNSNEIISSYFRFCPICIKSGHHNIFHQIKIFNQCIIHKVALVSICPICHNPISTIITDNAIPFQCNCGNFLFPIGNYIENISKWKEYYSYDISNNKTYMFLNNLGEKTYIIKNTYFYSVLKLKTDIAYLNKIISIFHNDCVFRFIRTLNPGTSGHLSNKLILHF
jgi:hypothetical protein